MVYVSFENTISDIASKGNSVIMLNRDDYIESTVDALDDL